AVVCMGGYNTMAEVMATDTPPLAVPRSRRRQEQPRRALALAAVGAVETRDAAAATGEQIARWWRRAVTGRTARGHIDLAGAVPGRTEPGHAALDGLAAAPRLAAPLLPAAVPAHPEVAHHVG